VHFANVVARGPQLPPTIAAQVRARKYDAALVAYHLKNRDLAFQYYPRKSGTIDEATGLQRRLLRAVLEADTNVATAAQIERRMNFQFNVKSLNERYRTTAEENIAQFLSIFLLILMYMAVILYGVTVAQGVIEEKTNRVMEIMIGTLRPVQLLAGKIIGIGLLALTQFALFGIVGFAMLIISATLTAHVIGTTTLTALAKAAGPSPMGQGIGLVTVPGSTWLYLVVFFLLGFFSYATLSAGIGALASRAEDVQSASAIYTIPMVMAYLISFFAIMDPEKPFVVWMSMVPLLSPMVMFTRISSSAVPIWQILVAIAASLITIWVLTLFAAKLYRVGVLMYGKPPRPADIWRALRAPA
jgi:ABC-2 type transport system permease protein